MNTFTITQPLPDVFHIQDSGQFCFTLICGSKSTLLFDTGIGLNNVAECVAPYVRGRLHVVLSHAHYDHACGQHYFPETLVHPDDLKACRRIVSRKSRTAILNRVQSRGLVPEGYPAEQFISGTPQTIKPLTEFTLDLGDLKVQFLHSPGHTAGSIVAWIEQRSLLLSGDTWNPTTWLFFPESMSLAKYTQTVRGLHDLPAEHVLRSHDLPMVPMRQFRDYADGLNEHTFAQAEPCPTPPYTNIRTFCCNPEPGSKLVFNDDKRS